MKKERKKGSGGARQGSGPKLKYGEPIKQVPFGIPISKVDYVKQQIQKLLDKWKV